MESIIDCFEKCPDGSLIIKSSLLKYLPTVSGIQMKAAMNIAWFDRNRDNVRNLIVWYKELTRNRKCDKIRNEFQGQRETLKQELIDKGIPILCSACGALEDITIDHILPIVKGGTNSIENLQFLCRSCNSKKGAG